MHNLMGQKFTRLSVLKRIGSTKDKRALWLCLCDCGNYIKVNSKNLLEKHTKSCGCLKIEKTIKMGKANKTHGYRKTSTYNVWRDMLDRCNNPNNIGYKNYGGRGVIVCDEWNLKKGGSFENFLKDMGEKPKGYQLDRTNNSLGYYKLNCKWVTPKINSRNKRNSHIIEYDGKKQCIAELAENYGIPYVILWNRLSRGLSIEYALSLPVKKYKKN